MHKERKRKNCNRIVTRGSHNISSIDAYRDLIWRFIMRIRWKASASPLHLSRGNRRLITPYILLFSLLLIIFYLGGLIMRGANTLIAIYHLS